VAQARSPDYDLLIIGGGINGAGVARDAAGRGLTVLLCDKGDLGGATSAASTKLIHGGLRYLEQYEFRLVRESLLEREVLLKLAPHIIWPLRFILPHDKAQRPSWLIRMGLFLYDQLGARQRLPGSRAVDLRHDPVGRPLKETLRRGFAYWDCWVQDNRLVVLNAMDAAARGAEIRVRTACVSARRENGLWHAELCGPAGTETVTARGIVNAAGPWVGEALAGVFDGASRPTLRLVKGSHIITRRLFDHDAAYLFQNPDGRIIFAIPYERDFTLIGTTDVDVTGSPERPAISEQEIDYLCRSASAWFAKPVTPETLVWSYAGVRPLHGGAAKGASAVSRDYYLQLDLPQGQAPLLNIFGGKLTTFRKLAEHVVDKIGPALGATGPAWTETGPPLPGGDLAGADPDQPAADLVARRPWLPAPLAQHLIRHYGSLSERLLGDAAALDQLGRDFGGGLYEAELAYAVQHEWVHTAEDFLWRRTKLGLRLSAEQRAAVEAWIAQRTGAVTAEPAAPG